MRFSIIAILFVALFAFGLNVQAASLYSLSDLMTRQAPSVKSDHTISFKTPAALISGQNIAIEFATGFNLSTIISSDVALSYGPSTGTENTAASSISISGTTLTVTNLGGSTAANDRITVKIGAVAGGAHQITNPSTLGTKIIRITLSNGAAGSLAVPIAQDTVGINPPTSSGGTNPPTINPDLPAPTITNPSCQIFSTPYLTSGDRPQDVFVFFNNLPDDILYPSITTWAKLVDYVIGSNPVDLYGIHLNGQRTATNHYDIQRCQIGDVNCNGQVNDFDLAGLAWHWVQNWCPSDFNKDLIVNDFDLAGLAAHWGR